MIKQLKYGILKTELKSEHKSCVISLKVLDNGELVSGSGDCKIRIFRTQIFIHLKCSELESWLADAKMEQLKYLNNKYLFKQVDFTYKIAVA